MDPNLLPIGVELKIPPREDRSKEKLRASERRHAVVPSPFGRGAGGEGSDGNGQKNRLPSA